jgi:hypothetical protein
MATAVGAYSWIAARATLPGGPGVALVADLTDT